MPQHVLAVAGAEVQPAQQVDQPLVQAAEGQFLTGVLAELLDVLVQFLLRGSNDLLDPCGVNAAVGDERVEGQAGDFPADHVEAADDDHARRVVNDQVHAGGLFEGADVATFSADDPPLHLVVGNAHRAGRRFGGMRGRVTLQRGDDDLAGFLFAGLGQLLVVAKDRRSGLLLELGIEDFQQAARGLGRAQAAELVQRLPLQIEELREVLLAVVGLLDLLGELRWVASTIFSCLRTCSACSSRVSWRLSRRRSRSWSSPRILRSSFSLSSCCLSISSLICSSPSRRRFSASCLALPTIPRQPRARRPCGAGDQKS